MNNITIKKTYEDSFVNDGVKGINFIEAEFVCQSDFVTAKNSVYIGSLDELVEKIELFLSGKTADVTWCSGTRGDGYTPFNELRFIRKDRAGHVLVEVFMEIDDGEEQNADSAKHNCCFYVNTEYGRLDSFVKGVSKLFYAEIGYEVSLNV